MLKDNIMIKLTFQCINKSIFFKIIESRMFYCFLCVPLYSIEYKYLSLEGIPAALGAGTLQRSWDGVPISSPPELITRWKIVLLSENLQKI